MSKQQEYIRTLINENTYTKNGKEYKRYYFSFEGKKYGYASYEKTYNLLESLINGVDKREDKKGNQEKEQLDKTIGEEIVKWFHEYKNTNVKPSTVFRVHQVIRYQIIHYLGNIKIKDLKQSDMQKAVDSCSSVSVAKQFFNYTRRFYNERKYLKFLVENPFENIKIERHSPKKEKSIFEKYEIESIIINHDKVEYGFCFYLIAKTGLRVGECTSLSLGDFKNNGNDYYISIRKTRAVSAEYDDTDFYKFTRHTENYTPKTKSSERDIPITTETFKELMEYLGFKDVIEIEKYIAENPDRPLFRTSKGSCVNHSVLTKNFYKLLDICCIPRNNRTIHSLRHTFATRMIMNGNDIKTVSAYLGHSSLQTTLSIYTHSQPEALRKALELDEQDEYFYKYKNLKKV